MPVNKHLRTSFSNKTFKHQTSTTSKKNIHLTLHELYLELMPHIELLQTESLSPSDAVVQNILLKQRTNSK